MIRSSSTSPTLPQEVEVSMPNTLMRNSFLSKAEAPGPEDADQVVVKGKEHQKNDQDQSDLLGDFHLLDTDRFSQDGFQSQEQEVASVENRDGKEIDQPEVDTQDCCKKH